MAESDVVLMEKLDIRKIYMFFLTLRVRYGFKPYPTKKIPPFLVLNFTFSIPFNVLLLPNPALRPMRQKISIQIYR